MKTQSLRVLHPLDFHEEEEDTKVSVALEELKKEAAACKASHERLAKSAAEVVELARHTHASVPPSRR